MKDVDLALDLQAEIEALKSENAQLKALIKYYEEQFRLSQQRRFGASSEKNAITPGQILLFDEAEVYSDVTAPEPELVEVEKHYRRASRTVDRLPEDLPVETIHHELPEEERICPECGEPLHVMSQDTRRELVIIPAQVQVREHVRDIYACRNCEKNNDHTPIVKAEMPEPVIKGGFASPEAVAHIAEQKFVMGVPLYRQEQDFQRDGILLSRQTMSGWLIRCTEDWLTPLYERMKIHLLEREVLHGDETTLQVLHEPGKTAQSKSYMWMYRTSGDAERPIVLYEYQPDRRMIRPAEFLKGFSGYLHADGYEGYHSLPDSITVVGCWAHARRKFVEALKALPVKDREVSLAQIGKRYCDKLFEWERKFTKLPPEERRQQRLIYSKPLMEELFAWADSLHAVPLSGIGKATHYVLTQRKYLERYLLDGRLEISNNRAERSIKPFVIGRKNWLFANTTKGAQSSAVLYSVIETAKENGLNPFAYLTFLFRALPNRGNAPVDGFLPGGRQIPETCYCPGRKPDGPEYPWDED